MGDDLKTAMRRLRAASGLTQAKFAARTGLSESLVGHVEAGTRSLSVENVEMVTAALHLSDEMADALRRARDVTTSALRRRPPADEDEVLRRLSKIEAALTELRGLLELLVGTDDVPATPPTAVRTGPSSTRGRSR